MIKNIDTMNEEIFLIDDIVDNDKVNTWWHTILTYGKWIKGFLAYGGNPPHVSMNKTGDPNFQEKLREQGGFSPLITGTWERNTWYMNVSQSQEAFTNAASNAYKTDDSSRP